MIHSLRPVDYDVLADPSLPDRHSIGPGDEGLFTQKCTYRHPLDCHSERSRGISKPCLEARLSRSNARPDWVNGAATANRRLRFLDFARNDIGALEMTLERSE